MLSAMVTKDTTVVLLYHNHTKLNGRHTWLVHFKEISISSQTIRNSKFVILHTLYFYMGN
jgi:hypothetical protein